VAAEWSFGARYLPNQSPSPPRTRGPITTGPSCCARQSLRLPSHQLLPGVMGPGSALAARADARPASLSGTTAGHDARLCIHIQRFKELRGSSPHSRGRNARVDASNASLRNRRGRRECRVKASPAAPVHDKRHGEGTTGSAESSGIPCAMVLTLISRSPWGPGLIAPITREIIISRTWPQRRDARTTRLGVRVSIVRPRAQGTRDAIASTASRAHVR
jgi:hypothetical protein